MNFATLTLRDRCSPWSSRSARGTGPVGPWGAQSSQKGKVYGVHRGGLVRNKWPDISKSVFTSRIESKWGAGIPAAVPGSRGPCVGVVAPLRGRHGANSSRPPFPAARAPIGARPNPPASPLACHPAPASAAAVAPSRSCPRYVRHTGPFPSAFAGGSTLTPALDAAIFGPRDRASEKFKNVLTLQRRCVKRHFAR